MDLALAEKVIPQRVDLLDRQGFIDQLQGIVDVLLLDQWTVGDR